MLFGSSMKLADRNDAKRDVTPKRNKSAMLDQKLFIKSENSHSYSFRWEKPKKFYTCDSAQYLTINNIILPEDVHAFNTGSSMEKWSKKRPRIKSTGLKSLRNSIPEDIFGVASKLEEISQEAEDDTLITVANDSGSEIDPDIQNLLCIVHEDRRVEDDDVKVQRKKHRHRRKDRNAVDDRPKEKAKKKKTKTIKFSLSKPPSPQTVQVIRVDVTSNYSFEEVNEEAVETESHEATTTSDCSKGCARRIKSANDLKKGLAKVIAEDDNCQEMKIQCSKLILGTRK